MNSEILLPQNRRQSAFFDNKENFEIINHLHLIFKCYLFKFRNTREISLEGLKKNIIKIYNIEKQIYFKESKKEAKFLNKWHTLENLLRLNLLQKVLGWWG